MKILNLITYVGLGFGAATVSPNSLNELELPNPIDMDAIRAKPIAKMYEEKLAVKPRISPSKALSDSQWDDVELLAHILYTERNAQVKEELMAIACVVANRMALKNTSLRNVVCTRKQFSGYRGKHWWRTPSQLHYEVAKEVLSKGVPYRYKDLLFFCNVELTKKINRKAYKWFMGPDLEEVITFPEPKPGLGKHTFFRSTKIKRKVNAKSSSKLK